jgi:ATP-dependent DNA ligase
MLARLARTLPDAEHWWYEPKWDGFRLIVFRDGDELYLQSRNLKPVLRYFPELGPALQAALPERCVVDGEIVLPRNGQLDFESLQLRLHPAKSRVDKLSVEMPAQVVLFDLLALGTVDHMATPFAERRALLEACVHPTAQVHVTPGTHDPQVAQAWFERFEGAGLDGVIAKDPATPYTPGQRTLRKVKHERTLDCVVAGFRWHKHGPGTQVGSLMLGAWGADGTLHSLGVAASFSADRRVELAERLAPLRAGALEAHPWASWAEADAHPGMQSRWSQGRDLSWEPVRLELVAEVSTTQVDGGRLRHPAKLLRLRTDKDPEECTVDQLDVTPAPELSQLLRGPSPPA